MTKRSKRRARARRRQVKAQVAADAAMGIVHPSAISVPGAEDGADLGLGLQYGEDDPIGFRTVEDGYIPIEQFTLFKKMPLELRRFVWNNVLPAPQTIYITVNGFAQSIWSGNVKKSVWIHRASATYKVPYLLTVSRETRQEVMINHPPSFAPQFGGVPIYYNHKHDLLHFDCPEAVLHFYGGSAPNYLPRSLTRGYRLNMRQFHTTVSQIAIGKVRASEGMLGGIFNQMKGLKVVLIENLIQRVEGASIIREYCDGSKELEMGWEEYTVVRNATNKVQLKLVTCDAFKEMIQGWTVSLALPAEPN